MKLTKFREKMGITQKKLAQELNFTPATLNKYENALTEPNIEGLIKLADYFHITIDELVGRPTNLINKMALSKRECSLIEKILTMNETQQELTEFYVDTLLKSTMQ